MSRTVLAPTAGLLVLLLLLLAPPAQAKKNKITRETLQSGGEERSYVLFVPDDLEPGVQVPLLLVLHGSRRDGKSIASKWDRLAKKEGFIVAGPESHNSDFWAAPEDGPEFLLDVVEAIQAEHPVDPSRVYLFGHSAGGHFVIQIGLWKSTEFAAVAAHAGAMQSGNEWLYERAKRKIPIFLVSGTLDQVVPILSVRRTHQELKDGGFPTEFWEMPRHDHWYYDLAGLINERAWEFLERYRLPAPRGDLG